MSVENPNLDNFKNQESEVPESEKGMSTLEPPEKNMKAKLNVNTENIEKAIKQARGEVAGLYDKKKDALTNKKANSDNTEGLEKAIASMESKKSWWKKLFMNR